MSQLDKEISRRRTVAIISHPDAGKTTLTEKLLLYSGAIHTAGNVTGGKRTTTTSDWMAIEQQRGISVSSSAMRVEYGDVLLNILDTPGHQDFSEDTYRTLMAVDCAIMLLDAGRGVQEQTIKLFKVCRDRGIPIITFINKMDRPALEPFELLDNVEKVLGITAVPLTWPVGDGPQFRGVYERNDKRFHLFEKTTGGMYKAPVSIADINDEYIKNLLGETYHAKLLEDLEMIEHVLPPFDMEAFLKAEITPVFWGSAITNFGVESFLQHLIDLAPPPQPLNSSAGKIEPDKDFFSAFVYKVQANMNKSHRDRISFVRVISGRFERGMTVKHPRSGKEVKLNYPFQLFGQDREILDEAFPGDVMGLTNPGLFSVGDVVTSGQEFSIPHFPRFAPEIFARVYPASHSYSKSFRKGIEQLGEEGVIQIFSDAEGSPSPLVAAVGELQLQVFTWRMEAEYNEKVNLERLPFTRTRWLGSDVRPATATTIAYDEKGRPVALFKSDWEMAYAVERTPGLVLLETPKVENVEA
jgi:peptide chain release factor 3